MSSSRSQSPTGSSDPRVSHVHRLSAVSSTLDVDENVSPRTDKTKTKNPLDPVYSSPPVVRSPKRNPIEDGEGRPSRRSSASRTSEPAAAASESDAYLDSLHGSVGYTDANCHSSVERPIHNDNLDSNVDGSVFPEPGSVGHTDANCQGSGTDYP